MQDITRYISCVRCIYSAEVTSFICLIDTEWEANFVLLKGRHNQCFLCFEVNVSYVVWTVISWLTPQLLSSTIRYVYCCLVTPNVLQYLAKKLLVSLYNFNRLQPWWFPLSFLGLPVIEVSSGRPGYMCFVSMGPNCRNRYMCNACLVEQTWHNLDG